MERQSGRHRERRKRIARPRISPRRLEALIEEAIVDAYNESEQAGSFHVMIEQELRLPFETTVLGARVLVKRVNISQASQILAVCHRGRDRQSIPILELPLPDRPPTGWEWIEAYRRWARRR